MILVVLFNVIWYITHACTVLPRLTHTDVAFMADLPTPRARSPGRHEQISPHSVFLGISTPGELK